MKCSHCGAETDEEALFCPECGKKLMKRCPSCGAVLPAEAKFCTECGARYEAMSPREPEKSPEALPPPVRTDPIRRLVEEKKDRERRRAEEERREKEEQLRQHRERLTELESLRNQPGYSILHPLQHRKNEKEAEELRSTIERAERELAKPKGLGNVVTGLSVLGLCGVLLISLGTFLSQRSDNSPAGAAPEQEYSERLSVSAADEQGQPFPAPTPGPVERSFNADGPANASPSVTVPTQSETTGDLVWVPVNGGKKYHRNSSCSNMENPMQVSRETAEANGYDPCKRCYG